MQNFQLFILNTSKLPENTYGVEPFFTCQIKINTNTSNITRNHHPNSIRGDPTPVNESAIPASASKTSFLTST